jgi:hypothetical protein
VSSRYAQLEADLRKRPSNFILFGMENEQAGSPRDNAAGLSAGQEVEVLERRYSVRLPDDFKAYLLAQAPAQESWDDWAFGWWPVHRIRNIPDEYEHPVDNAAIAAEAPDYLFFADYMIWCWAWAICCSEGINRGKVAVIGAPRDHFVATSFSDFMSRYARDPELLANG